MENAILGQRDHPQYYTDLHVQNLAEKLAEEQLRELFVPFGTISSLVVVKEETGRSKGVDLSATSPTSLLLGPWKISMARPSATKRSTCRLYLVCRIGWPARSV